MSRLLIEKLAKEFKFSPEEEALLAKSKRQLNREERKIFYEKINPHRRTHREYLMHLYETVGAEERKKWYEETVESLLDKGGEADIVDELAIDVIGRIEIYAGLREKAQQEGKTIKALADGGGCVFFLIIAGIIIMLILMIKYS